MLDNSFDLYYIMSTLHYVNCHVMNARSYNVRGDGQ